MSSELNLTSAKVGGLLLYRKTCNTSVSRNYTVGKEYLILDACKVGLNIKDDRGTSRWVSYLNYHKTWEVK